MLTIKDKNGNELIDNLNVNIQFLEDSKQLFVIYDPRKVDNEDLEKFEALLSKEQEFDMGNGQFIFEDWIDHSAAYTVDSVIDLTPRNSYHSKISTDTILVFSVSEFKEF
ncbi:hypothetical protein EHJ37_19720 [Vibrio parahaemolyticus]|nr:hypothetical protein [Vibrio parahaemolyticus]